jgi:hypothetical protein
LHTISCKGRGYKDVYGKLLNNGRGVKGKGRVFEGIEWTKVKHANSGHALRQHFKLQLKY